MSLAQRKRLAHDEALMALDYAHVAAQQVLQDLSEAMREEPHYLAAHLKDVRTQLAEIERSLREVDDYAKGERL